MNSLSLLQSYSSDCEDEHGEGLKNQEAVWDCTHFFNTNEIFHSREELTSWCKAVGRTAGVVVGIKRSDRKEVSGKERISYCCERSGQYKQHTKETSDKPIKRTGTKKCGCPFLLKGVKLLDDDIWKVQVVCGKHNHPVNKDTTLEGHAYVGRLSSSEKKIVVDLSKTGVKAREVLRVLKQNNPNNASTIRTVYNFKAKHQVCELQGRSQMQQLLKVLNDKGYVEFHRRANDTDELLDLFFAHPYSIQLLKCFPEVLMLDNTYKTNRHSLPLLEIVGVTSTEKTFVVAHAYLQREEKENFLWALQCLQTILHPSTKPSVFITDRDIALMNAITQVFPDARHLLCTWHVSKNILKKAKPMFKKNEECDSFMQSWHKLYTTPTEELYNNNYKKFQGQYAKYKELLTYIDKYWLSKYKEKFVLAWTNFIMHFGNLTNNRVEAQHSSLKRYLGSSKGNLCTNFLKTDDLLMLQHVTVRDSFAISLSSSLHDHRISEFNNLRGFISRGALEKILREKIRGEKVGVDVTKCGCVLKQTHGLPCAHDIVLYKREGRAIPLSSIHPRWRKLTDVPIDQTTRSLDCKPLVAMVMQKFDSSTEEQQCMMMKVLLELAEPSATNMEQPSKNKVQRGRPRNKAGSSKIDYSTKRDPSAFEIAMTGEEKETQQSVNKLIRKRQKQQTKKIIHKRKKMSLTLKDLTDEELREQVLFEFDPKIREHIIDRVEDVAPDGHCGYRCCAELLNMGKEDGWKNIRMEMLNELWNHRVLYMSHMGGEKCYKEVEKALNYFRTNCPVKYWMKFPDMGFLFASTFNCVLSVLSASQYETYLPLRVGPPEEFKIISLVLYDGNHFLKAILKPGAPVPKVVPGWENICYPVAREWEPRVSAKFIEWESLIGYPSIGLSSDHNMKFDFPNTIDI